MVATWKHQDMTGHSLVLGMDAETVTFATGPSPWGCASWGPVPRSCVLSVRPLRLEDRWRVEGTLGAEWGPEELLGAMKRARSGREPSEAERMLQIRIDQLKGARANGRAS